MLRIFVSFYFSVSRSIFGGQICHGQSWTVNVERENSRQSVGSWSGVERPQRAPENIHLETNLQGIWRTQAPKVCRRSRIYVCHKLSNAISRVYLELNRFWLSTDLTFKQTEAEAEGCLGSSSRFQFLRSSFHETRLTPAAHRTPNWPFSVRASNRRGPNTLCIA